MLYKGNHISFNKTNWINSICTALYGNKVEEEKLNKLLNIFFNSSDYKAPYVGFIHPEKKDILKRVCRSLDIKVIESEIEWADLTNLKKVIEPALML